jgi:hypothetical protein
MQANREKGEITEQGWQYCQNCNQDTKHTPKLGLVIEGKRLCTRCNTSNNFEEDGSK